MTDLVLDQLVAHRGRPLFAPISERIAPGTLVGVVGPNGTGKSSLLSAIIGRGIERSGTARYGTTALGQLRPRQLAKVVSFVGQDTFAPNDLRAGDVVAVGARAPGHTADSEARSRRARSEERRVGKECGSRGPPSQGRKREEEHKKNRTGKRTQGTG